MSLPLNDNKWFKSSLFGIVLLSIPLLWVWLTGAFFMEMTGSPMEQATPLTAYQYYHHYGEQTEVMKLLVVAALFAFVVMILPVVAFLIPKTRSLHGDARFANTAEIRKAGLFATKGIIVGKLGGRYLTFGGQQHVLMDAPTRGGKGVGIVIPNMLSWPDSVVVLDIKQENWQITSGYRQQHGQACYLFNPATRNYQTHRWNPLFYISDDPHFRINDIQKIGSMMFPDVDGSDPIWSASSRSLFLALVLYCIETDELPVTLGEIYRQVTAGRDKRFIDIIKERQDSDSPLSPECVSAFNDYLSTSTNTRTSIRKTFTSRLELWANPVIDAATSDNDFDLRTLRKQRMSVYVGITPDDLGRLGPIINLFFQQVIDLNTRELPEHHPDLKYQCLLLMDEFAAIGKINILSKGISYIAGYGLRMLPIIQSPAQLRDIYGKEQATTFIDNHALRIIFAPKNIETAEEISKTLGDTTVKSKSRTKQLVGRSGKSLSVSDHRRALLLPQEVKQIGQWQEILILENAHPIQCKKIRYFNDKTFTSRLLGAAKPPTLIIEDQSQAWLDTIGRSVGTMTTERAVTAEDVKNMDQMNLDDFSCDFSHIEVPEGDLSENQMNELVDQFFEGVSA